MLFQIYRQHCVGILLAFLFFGGGTPLLMNVDGADESAAKLAAIFPMAEKFVLRKPLLTPDQITSIQKKLGAKLRAEDQKPVFYIPISASKKPLGLVLFAGADGPNGIIEGGVGLDMRGKVVKVAVYEHKETDGIAGEKFLNQFIGMGIDDAFKVGEDIQAVEGHEDASNAVALIPKKTLVMGYTLFPKRKPEPDMEEEPQPDTSESSDEEMPEVDDLKALMALMIDDYFVVVDYFDDKESKDRAIEAAKQLAKYGKIISDFEPPKNADQTEEYVYLQDTFSENLLKFAEALEKEGISDETRKQWDTIVTLVNQAHLRFSEEEIDLDAY